MVLYQCENCGKIYYSASLVTFSCASCGSKQFSTQSPSTQQAGFKGRSRPIALGDHGLLLFDDEQGFLSYALPFIRDGLNQAHQVTFAISPAQQSLLEDKICTAERKAITINSGKGIYDDPFDPLETLSKYERQLSDSKRPFRLMATVDVLVEAGVDAETLMSYEAQAHRRLVNDRVSIICAYDTRNTPNPILKSARITHPLRSSVNGGFEGNPEYDPEAGMAT